MSPDHRRTLALRRTAAATALVVWVGVLGGGGVVGRATDLPGALRIRGADISFTLQEEALGTSVRGPDGELPIEQVLAGHGASHVRLRVLVDPVAGASGLPAALELGRRATAAGLGIILALHYSDTWADHSHQVTPAAWAHLGLDELERVVAQYTRDTISAFARQGTPITVAQIGNEIDDGLLWPAGSPATAGWSAVTRLVAAGVEGARVGAGAHRLEVMVHLAASGNTAAVTRFVGRLVTGGIDVDLVGLSYYPWWHGSLDRLSRTLDAVTERFDVDVLLAETAYPWTLENGDAEPNAVTSNIHLPDSVDHPATPEGQATWAEAVRRLLQDVPGGRGAGFLFWEPGWLPGVEAVPGTGSVYDNTTLFTWDGTPLPALLSLRAPTSRD